MVIIYQEQEIIKHVKHFMHQQQNLMEKKRKEKVEYLLHERALLMKEYFRIQRTLFNSLKPKILYLQKRSS